MTNIFVTTGADVVDATDGKTSLREAIAQAKSGDTILFHQGSSTVATIVLASPLVIAAGKNITIEGGDKHAVYNGGSIQGQIVIDDGATVTMRHLNVQALVFADTHDSDSTAGDNGDAGKDGLPGASNTSQPGTNGKDGENGKDAVKDSQNGAGIIGAIENRGNLTLDHVIVSGEAHAAGGGSGADGGFGGGGGEGGSGGYDPNTKVGGNGGAGADGGDGGDGADGTDGGSAVGGIYNSGTLTLIDTLVSGTASGSGGGTGGRGGAGAGGGLGGDGKNAGNGGDGGTGGDGGAGGDGGDAVGGILNVGKIIIKGAALLTGTAEAGDGGEGGDAGEGGTGAHAGTPLIGGATGVPGTDGNDGATGTTGKTGAATDTILNTGKVTGNLGIDKHLYEFTSTTAIGQSVLGVSTAATSLGPMSIIKAGFTHEAGTVGWHLLLGGSGLSASDFTTGTSGTVTYTDSDSLKFLQLSLKAGVTISATTHFQIALTNASHGDLLGSTDTVTEYLFAVTNAADNITGSAGSDRIDAAAGNDTIKGGLGDDTITGGAGNDTVVFSGKSTSYTIDKQFAGVATITDNRTSAANEGVDSVDGVEYLKFSDKTITIGTVSNTAPTHLALSNSKIAENAAVGTVVGRLSATDAQDDPITWSLSGGDGLFKLVTKNGVTSLAVKAPLDFETAASHKVTLTASDGKLQTSTTVTVSVTDVIDVLTGTSKANTLTGASGVDRISGLGGNDTLHGLGGNDILIGGTGIDKLYGGPGADTFVFKTGDSAKTRADADTIFDFTKTDHIDLSGWDANSKKSGVQGFDFIGSDAFSKHVDELHFVKAKSDTWIEGDTNGDGKADFVIHLDDAVALKHGNFDL